LKILYAACNRKGAQLQLGRFLSAVAKDGHQIKIAGFNASLPGFYMDWTLDALLDMFNLEHISFDNDNLRIYFNQVKSFDPDLIISDLEIFSSHVGLVLNKPVWQVSPLLLYHGLNTTEKTNMGVYKNYSYIFNKQATIDDLIRNALANADKKFVYSHFGDVTNTTLVEGFEWVRPYHVKGKISVPCQHNICAVALTNEKKYVNYLNKFEDTVLFSTNLDEEFAGVTLKDISNEVEYGCNLKNCFLAINQGFTDLLADAYYNNKFCSILPDFSQAECVINALYTEHLGLGKVIYQEEETINFEVNSTYNRLEFLHEKIKGM
jgi:uncharacterized protein (TIGR00661 family)